MESVKIIPEQDYDKMKQIVEEYLPGTDDMTQYIEQFPSTIVGYYIHDELIGVCYGSEFSQNEFSIDGIAIVRPYNGVGRGGKLISLFEQNVSLLGYKKISVGSAGGYVEGFYMKNGYVPVELKMYAKSSEWQDKSQDCLYPIAYTQKEGERLKIVISVVDYDAMKKEEIEKYYNCEDAFFVFVKELE